MTEQIRYPAKAYDRDLDPDQWKVLERNISQITIGEELAHSVREGFHIGGGPLRTQLPDGSVGAEDGTAVSIVWGRLLRPDGSRTLLGWYESSR
jgi:hypothetical protein